MRHDASRRFQNYPWAPPGRGRRRWQPGPQGFDAGRELPGVDDVARGGGAGDADAQMTPHGPAAKAVARAVAYVLVVGLGLTIGGFIGLILALFTGLITIAC